MTEKMQWKNCMIWNLMAVEFPFVKPFPSLKLSQSQEGDEGGSEVGLIEDVTMIGEAMIAGETMVVETTMIAEDTIVGIRMIAGIHMTAEAPMIVEGPMTAGTPMIVETMTAAMLQGILTEIMIVGTTGTTEEGKYVRISENVSVRNGM